jgi:hypothetical protein
MWDLNVRVWDLAVVGKAQILKLNGRTVDAYDMTFSSDGHRLASCSRENSAQIWDLERGGEPLVLKGHAGDVTSLSFSLSGDRLASGSADKSVRVWDVEGGSEKLVLKGHTDSIWSLSFSTDGHRLVSGSTDGTVQLWDLVAGSAPLALRVNNGVTRVCFSPDGRRIASCSELNTVCVHEIDCQHLWRLRQTTDAEWRQAWFSALFHLRWLIQEERAKQCCEMTSGFTSPSPFGAAANVVALQDREGRVLLPELEKRRFRATMQLAGWFWY